MPSLTCAADLAPLEREARPGSVAPDGAYGTTMPGDDVGRAAHDPGLPLAGGDVDQRQLVGVGVRLDVEHLRATMTPVISSPGCSTPSTSRPSWLSAETMSATGASTGREVADPGERCAHRVPQYCARKRTSPSKKVLISSMS